MVDGRGGEAEGGGGKKKSQKLVENEHYKECGDREVGNAVEKWRKAVRAGPGELASMSVPFKAVQWSDTRL